MEKRANEYRKIIGPFHKLNFSYSRHTEIRKSMNSGGSSNFLLLECVMH